MTRVIDQGRLLEKYACSIWGALCISFFATAPDLAAAPVISGADHSALPEGETITLTGTGLGTATAARMLWNQFNVPTTINPVSDTSLEVVMPDLPQDIREHILIVESPDGSTVAVPATFIEHTSTGSNGSGPPGSPIVVRAGATLDGPGPGRPIIVETGGVLRNPAGAATIIVAENGAVVDFTGVSSMNWCQFFYSPDTVIIGSIPSGLASNQLTAIKTSHGIDTFTVGYGIDLTVVGVGSVSSDPDQTYYRRNTSVTLTATPGANNTFSGWSGSQISETNPLTVSAGSSPISLTASFSTGWLLDIYAMPGVTVTASPDAPAYDDGTSVTLTAVLDPGYDLLGWAGDASGDTLTTTLTMDDHRTVIPLVRPSADALIPQITSVDHTALPEGETITLTGTGLGTATAARMLWRQYNIPAAVTPVNDTTLKVVMPDIPQDIQEHLLIVESPAGSTVAVPATFIEHTFTGSNGSGPPGTPIVVRAGATLDGAGPGRPIIVETGGVLRNPPGATVIVAENGAVVDFTGIGSMFASQLFHSPETVIIGPIPSGLAIHELTSIKASHGIGTFTVGYGINLNVVGDGSVTTNPDQTYFRRGTSVTLTATPGVNTTFSGWSGSLSAETNPLTVSAGTAPISLTASFSAGWLLDIYAMPGITVTTSLDAPVYADGTSVTLTAVPDPGYDFLGWSGDASGTDLSTTLTMDANLTVIPLVRPTADALIPQVTSADHLALPKGETITLTGTGLGTATAARMLWNQFDIPATVTPVNDTTLEVVMPDLFQDIREHILLVESPAGSTVAIPPNFIEQTFAGTTGSGPPGTPVVVRAGAILHGLSLARPVFVETGGVLVVGSGSAGVIWAENGAVVDFTGVSSMNWSQFYHSPDTVIIGALPTGLTSHQLTPIRASFGVGTFTAGYPLNLVIEGPGSVSISPEKEFYSRNESVSLTATPAPGAFFIRWIGPLSGTTTPATLRIRGDGELIARFSTAPDYFSVWRLEHFTIEELGDIEISAFDADPDRDSLANAAEYAFGSNPRMADGKRKLRVKRRKIDGEFRQFVEYFRPKNALDVTYQILLSTDTLTWNFNGDDTDLVYSVERSVEDVDEDTELVTAELYPDTESPKTFFVKISALLFE